MILRHHQNLVSSSKTFFNVSLGQNPHWLIQFNKKKEITTSKLDMTTKVGLKGSTQTDEGDPKTGSWLSRYGQTPWPKEKGFKDGWGGVYLLNDLRILCKPFTYPSSIPPSVIVKTCAKSIIRTSAFNFAAGSAKTKINHRWNEAQSDDHRPILG